ncbi:diguanylate cyclase [Halothiobacillus sp. DCM-1]|uniref:GGDEF domain-containing response regulator n=1 Tax=Halothiobacillus sp. DCM-1 TaxID=3112558 RepID=UPI003247E51B
MDELAQNRCEMTDWAFAIASLDATLSDISVPRTQRIADFVHQTQHLLGCARETRQSQLANALDRLLHAAEREQFRPSEDFSRLIRLIRHLERLLEHKPESVLPSGLVISKQPPGDDLRDILLRNGFSPLWQDASVATLSDLRTAIESASVIMMITDGADQEDMAMSALDALKNLLQSKTTIVIAARDSFLCRVLAVKTGISHFLTEPVDFVRLNVLLQAAHIVNHTNSVVRVLMVDDMNTIGLYWSKHFAQANIDFRFESKPESAYRTALEFNPDVILLDLYMPDIDGIDLAKIFREQPRLQDVPILFMSTEENDRLRLDAKIQGGDDFLNKTIAIDDLLRLIRRRALRHRQSLAEKRSDSLTGLLNHLSIKALVETEIERAYRQNQSLSIAMLDIDRFKNINDKFGHQTGDTVIRKLANLLNTRLRRYDGVGRYGGEEFLITLPNTDEVTAVTLIDRLRAVFADCAIEAENGQKIFCTFSAGVASFPAFLDPVALIEAADQSLYLAKNNGRNQVVCVAGSQSLPPTHS